MQLQKTINDKIFTSKANTLEDLYGRLVFGRVETLYILSYKDFASSKKNIVNEINKKFHKQIIIIRSSSLSEDRINCSNAGKYKTIENVDSDDEVAVVDAIEQIFASYGKPKADDQVFVQKQIANSEIKYAGVAYTHQLITGKPYYIINFDETTNGVTSGKAGRAICISREHKGINIEKEWEALLCAIKELEEITQSQSLDIEFAITSKNEVIIFQVRPIKNVLKHSDRLWEVLFTENDKLKHIVKDTGKFFSDMAFWNPSEIIGDNPFPLDYSIYAELVTNKAWNVGIRDLGFGSSDSELMIKIGNKPYIDLIESFFALTPIELSETLKRKLTDFYLMKIKNVPTLHDKVEFQVVINSFFFGVENYIEKEFKEYLNKDEKRQLYIALKFNLIKNLNYYLLAIDRDKKELDRYLTFISEATYSNCDECLSFIRKLVDVLRDVVVPIFARHARMAFMAKILYDSLAEQEYITEQEKNIFYSSFASITSEFLKDYSEMQYEVFLNKYGHLRAGTYNLRVKSYKESVFKPYGISAKSNVDISFLNEPMEKALRHEGIDIDANIVIDYIKTTITLREKTKFDYSKGVSRLLDAIVFLGEKLGIKRDDLSYLDISNILELDLNNIAHIEKCIGRGKKLHETNSLMILPNVIFEDTDLRCVHVWEGSPNFITSKKVLGEIIYLTGTDICNCDGKIVLIENADPGYDWLFTFNIKGLITKYGGMGSHMAIRCSELDIPAALGCGSIMFDKIAGAEAVLLDCESKNIIIGE